VAIISYLGALSTGLNSQQADWLYVAGALHDIGKIWIPDHVLQKRENLTAEENAWLNKHPEIGADIIRPISTLKEIAEMVLHHHERFDGSGYPHGLQGENISLGARIVGAANGLALHSERCNSSLAGAISAARSDDVSAYDPQVITAIEKVHEKIAEWLKVIE
jgi:HD-GYP domain-containing protein (c-di-GMP phosphodiesterase class II)